jgi:hypothetical protein
MDFDNLTGAQMVTPDGDPQQEETTPPTDQPAAGGQPDLAGLLGGAGAASNAASGQPGGVNLAGLLGGLLGGSGANGLIEQSGVSSSVLQAALPLVLNALMQGRPTRAADVSRATALTPGDPTSHPTTLAELVGQMQAGQSVDTQDLQATGVPQELARRTGLNHADAASALKNILETLLGAH